LQTFAKLITIVKIGLSSEENIFGSKLRILNLNLEVDFFAGSEFN
jgi:hypothetical protein